MAKRILAIFLLFLPFSLSSQNIDIRILRSLNSSQPLSSDKFFRFMSNSKTYVAIGIPVGIAAAGLTKHDDRLVRNACLTLVSAAVCTGFTNILKYSAPGRRSRMDFSYCRAAPGQ